jgi:hypothetical protein
VRLPCALLTHVYEGQLHFVENDLEIDWRVVVPLPGRSFHESVPPEVMRARRRWDRAQERRYGSGGSGDGVASGGGEAASAAAAGAASAGAAAEDSDSSGGESGDEEEFARPAPILLEVCF